jgi:D-sedoheptulose 7-phosphate isomerase
MENFNNTFLIRYTNQFTNLIKLDEHKKRILDKILKTLLKYRNKNTVHIFGNGGSSSIASHFSMDLTNNTNIKCISYNDPAIITCYSNDFGYENWIGRAIAKYGKKNDLLILISSSGESKNLLNAIKSAKNKKFTQIISFTGFKKNNSLGKKSNLNLWINSREYNLIENAHQFYLLALVDMIKKVK